MTLNNFINELKSTNQKFRKEVFGHFKIKARYLI